MDAERRRIAERNREVQRRFDAAQPYLEASRRVRETFARHQLTNVLNWSFAMTNEIADLSDDDLGVFLDGVRGIVSAVEPAWAPAMDDLRKEPVSSVRRELTAALPKIRAIAHNVVANRTTDAVRVTVEISIPPARSNDQRPRWGILRGRLDDALIWVVLRLFSEVPRSLIRSCDFSDCQHVFVAVKNQRHCLTHQREANRQAQRRAEQAFRKRQRAQKEGK